MAEDNGNPQNVGDEYDQFVSRLMETKRTRKRGWPRPSQDKGTTDPRAVPSIPEGCRSLGRNIRHIDQITFAHLVRSLEILTGIAECTTIPVAIRQRAAEVVVETGVSILKGPKGIPIIKPGMPAADAQRGLVTRVPMPQEAESPDAIPPGWGEEPDEPDEEPAKDLPPPPESIVLDEDSRLAFRIEEHVLSLLKQQQSLSRVDLRIAAMTDSHKDHGKDVVDFDLLLEGMIAKGKIRKHEDPVSHAVVYHLPKVVVKPSPATGAVA